MKLKLSLTAAILFEICAITNSQQVKEAGRITSTGYWIHNNVEEIPGLKSGPFVRLSDGSILTVERNLSLISNDEGKSWKKYPIFNIADTSRFILRVERLLIRTGSGVIILAFTNQKGVYYEWDNDINDAKPGSTYPNYVIRSLDEGRTWQDLQKLTDEPGMHRDIKETKDGNIIFTSQILRHNPGHHAIVTYTTKTNGLDWVRSNIIDLGGVGHHSGVVEGTIEQLKDGRIWMLMRTNWGVFWEAYSENEGYTWKNFKPTKIDASSAPGLLTRLNSGRLFLVWNRAYPEGKNEYPMTGGDGIVTEIDHSNNREELSIMFSDDDGKSWSIPVVIARITEKSIVKRLAYPRVFEARPGEIWVTTTYAGFAGYLSVKLFEKDFFKE